MRSQPHQTARFVFDNVTPGRRRIMAANKGKNTKPELAVRQLLHTIGYRYRIHLKDLPGKPDIVFTARRKIVEIRGCFWHGHGCFPLGQPPKSRTEYWEPKIAGNKARDIRNMSLLKSNGWNVLEIWECRLHAAVDETANELVAFLGPTKLNTIGALDVKARLENKKHQSVPPAFPA